MKQIPYKFNKLPFINYSVNIKQRPRLAHNRRFEHRFCVLKEERHRSNLHLQDDVGIK